MEIDLSKPDASEERSKLKRFHAFLNSPTLVPEQAYRPASIHYPLVCKVNCILALTFSKNYEAIPPFITGALREIGSRPATAAIAPYYDVVNRYLRQVAYVLRNFTSVSRESLQHWVPLEVLDAGPQEVPNITMQATCEDARA